MGRRWKGLGQEVERTWAGGGKDLGRRWKSLGQEVEKPWAGGGGSVAALSG